MKLRKVISGGQTGADRTGLECAREMGLETGGTAPKGYVTENGLDPSWKDFGVVEDDSHLYPPRTRKNVQDSDATVWFGNTGSPGYLCTENAAKHAKKHFYVNPDADVMRSIAEVYEVINVAGNRISKNRGVVQLVKDAFNVLR